jgi:hypothetical protein
MITSVAGLQKARSRWLGAGKDPKLFDTAVTALDCATTNIDVVKALPSPTFSVRTMRTMKGAGVQHPETWRIYANGELLLDLSTAGGIL